MPPRSRMCFQGVCKLVTRVLEPRTESKILRSSHDQPSLCESSPVRVTARGRVPDMTPSQLVAKQLCACCGCRFKTDGVGNVAHLWVQSLWSVCNCVLLPSPVAPGTGTGSSSTGWYHSGVSQTLRITVCTAKNRGYTPFSYVWKHDIVEMAHSKHSGSELCQC